MYSVQLALPFKPNVCLWYCTLVDSCWILLQTPRLVQGSLVTSKSEFTIAWGLSAL